MGKRQNPRPSLTVKQEPPPQFWIPKWVFLTLLGGWILYSGRTYFSRADHAPNIIASLEPIISAPYFNFFGTPPFLLFSHIAQWVWIITFIFMAFHIGDSILKHFKFYEKPDLTEIVTAIGLGLLIFSYTVFLLLTLKLLYGAILLILLSLLLAFAAYRHQKIYSRWIPPKELCLAWLHFPLIEKLALLTLGLFCGLLFIASFAPEVFYDSLVYHLALPYVWLKDHAFTSLPFLAFSTMPTQTQLNYVWGHAGSEIFPFLHGDTLGRMLHFSLALLTTTAVYGTVKPLWGRFCALLSGIFFFAIPVITMNAWTSGNDVGTGLYQTLAVLLLIKWKEKSEPSQKLWILSAIFIGAALSSKYTAIFGAAATFLIAAHFNFWRYSDTKNRFAPILLYGLVMALVWSPWILKNIISTGNPLHPFLFGIFGGQNISDILKWKDTGKDVFLGAQFNIFNMLQLDFIWNFITSFWRVAMTGNDSVKYAGPVLLLFGPAILFLRKWPSPIKITGWIFILSYFFWFLGNEFARYLAPAYPCMAITLAFAWVQTQKIVPNKFRAILSAIPLVVAFLVWCQMANMVHHIHAPWDIITGKITRQDYLSHSRATYPNPSYMVYQYANENLPQEGTRILLLGDNKAFGLKHSFYYYTVEYNNPILQTWIKESKDGEELYQKMLNENLTHMIINYQEFIRLHHQKWNERDKEVLSQFWDQHVQALPYFAESTAIYKIVEFQNDQKPPANLIVEIDKIGWKPGSLFQSFMNLQQWDEAILEAEAWAQRGSPVFDLLAKLYLQRNKPGDIQRALSAVQIGLQRDRNHPELNRLHQILTQPPER